MKVGKYSKKKYAWGDQITPTQSSLIGLAGTTIGNTFNTSPGIQPNKGKILAGSAISDAATGFSIAGPVGALAGAGYGIISGLSNYNNQQRQYSQQQGTLRNNLTSNSQATLANYPTNGLPQAGHGMRIISFGQFTHPNYFRGSKPRRMSIGCYANGGKLGMTQGLPMPTDDSDATQLASNMAVYNGDTHQQGGINLDTNQDGQPDIEAENNEVIKDDMVLSDRLKPSDMIKNHLRKLGIAHQENDSYASIAERLGKKKGYWEDKVGSHLVGEHTAAQKMIQKFDEAGDILFQDQQSQKKGIDQKKFALGGNIGDPDKGKKDSNTNPLGNNNGWEMTDDRPSNKEGYRIRTFSNNTALPNSIYNKPVTKEDYLNNSGAFTNTALDFPLNQARTAFENGRTQQVLLGQEKPSVAADVNPTYPLLQRIEEYKDNPIPLQAALKYAKTSPINIPNFPTQPRKDNYVGRKSVYSNISTFATDNGQKMMKKGQFPSTTYSNGGKIHIKPSHEGRFTAYKERTGETTEEALHSKNSHVRQMANFARNAKHFKHSYGGYYANGGWLPKYGDGDQYTYGPRVNSQGKAVSPGEVYGNGEVDTDNYFGYNQQSGSGLDNNFGNIAAGIGFLGNQNQINKLQTNFQPTLAPTPINTYTDQTNNIVNRNLRQFRTFQQGFNSGSGQDNTALKANAYASTIDNINQGVSQEQQRKDAYTQHYNQMLQYNNFFNTQMTNTARQESFDNQNQKVALGQHNFNNLVNSALGNKQFKDQQDLDYTKAAIYGTMDGGSGVSDRYNEFLKKKLGRKYGQYFGN